MKLYPYQQRVLEETKDKNRVAYYLDMGLGKTFVGTEKMKELGADTNLIICQKSKITDWVEHLKKFCPYLVFNLSNKKEFEKFMNLAPHTQKVGVINYDLIHRRLELLMIKDFTLMLDESSLIQNPYTKRTKTILKLKASNVILLSGTPTDGKYECLWTQAKLLGWGITKKMYFDHYIIEEKRQTAQGIIYTQILGYKNVERLKTKFREHGAVFMKTEEAIELPEQTFQKVYCELSELYKKFMKNKIVEVENKTLLGDTNLTQRLYARQLCGVYSKDKLQKFNDILESTSDRLIVFYNFTEELDRMMEVCNKLNKPYGVVNGQEKNINAYENYSDSITFVQYQAGAMGLNLQKANKIIYYSLPESSALFEQSKKRIHRVGQKNKCLYYILICRNSIEEKILKALEMRKDFTDFLFKEGLENEL